MVIPVGERYSLQVLHSLHKVRIMQCTFAMPSHLRWRDFSTPLADCGGPQEHLSGSDKCVMMEGWEQARATDPTMAKNES